MSAHDVLVVGAGVMGIGIAQVAAQAGHRVFVFDQLPSSGSGWLGSHHIVSVLEALDECYRGERYRVSPLLQRA